MWADALRANRLHVEALAAEGIPSDGMSPRHMQASEIAVNVMRGLGLDPASLLQTCRWERSADGYTTRLEGTPFIDEAVFHRHLDQLRLSNVTLSMGSGLLMIDDDVTLADTRIEIHGAGALPETAAASAIGRTIGELVSLPGRAGHASSVSGCEISADGAIMITTPRTTTTLA